jgi:hypothetical protein
LILGGCREIPFVTDDASDAPLRDGRSEAPREPRQSEGWRWRERDARVEDRVHSRVRALAPSERRQCIRVVFEQPGHDGRFGYQYLRPFQNRDGFLPKRGGIEAEGAPVANEGLILHFLKREIWVVIVQRLGDALY